MEREPNRGCGTEHSGTTRIAREYRGGAAAVDEEAERRENPGMSALSPRLAKLTLLPIATLLAADLVLLSLSGDFEGLFYIVYVVAFATLGLIVASREPTNPMLWIFLAAAMLIVLYGLVFTYALYGVLNDSAVPAAEEAAWVADFIWPLADFMPAILILLFFPSGHLASDRWRPVVWLTAVGLALAFLGFALEPRNLQSNPEFSSIENPHGIEGAGVTLRTLAVLGAGLLLAAIAAAATSLVVRLRRARGDERQQLKWVAAGAVLWAMALILGASFFSFYDWAAAFVVLAPLAIVVTTAIAVLKYRLYGIDIVIRRTLVYGALTAVLAGAYFAIVVSLQQVFSSFAGGSDLAIAVSTLAVAALFVPARRRIQNAVDRRFYRRKYDAEQTLEAFSARLREEIDLEALDIELRTVVTETMRPAHVSLWLREVRR